MTLRSAWISLALLAVLGGCASSGKSTDSRLRSAPSTPGQAAAAEKKREAKERPPVNVGSDIIVEKPATLIWPILIKVEDWGSWMNKVTKVEPGAGLSPGVLIKWQWEEKSVESEIVSVKENEEFSFKSCASSKKAVLKWGLKAMGPKRTLVSLRAAVPYGTASEVMAKLGPEMNEWITALQTAANKVKGSEDEEE